MDLTYLSKTDKQLLVESIEQSKGGRTQGRKFTDEKWLGIAMAQLSKS